MVSADKEYLYRIRDTIKARRVAMGYKQSEAAARAGITIRSLQHFEQTGKISLARLLKLIVVYRMEKKIMEGFDDRTSWTLEELERSETREKVR
jgi:transcriptional regulator with XRE-family HTH domain